MGRPGLRRPGRRRAHARGLRRVGAGDAVRGGRGAAARADARRPEGRPPAPAARDADAARADLPALRRRRRCSRGPAGEPALDVEEGGVRTRVWPVEAGERRRSTTPLLIADGHHRYETAVAYRAENPEATHTFADPRLVARARARDLPDAPPRAGSSATCPASEVDRAERRRHALPRRPLHRVSRPTTTSARASSSRSRPRASRTRRTPTRRSRRSTAARRRPRSCSSR